MTRQNTSITSEQTYRKLIETIYGQCIRIVLISFFMALLVVALMWNYVPHTTLLWWMLAMSVISLARVISVRHYYKPDQITVSKAEQIYLAGVFANGCVWGSTIFLLNPQILFTLYTVILIVAGMSFGAAFSNLSYPRGYWVFTIPTVSPVLIWLTISPVPFQLELIALLVAGIVSMTCVVYIYRDRVTGIFRLSEENKLLVQQLSEVNSVLQKSEDVQNQIILSIPDALLIVGQDGNIVHTNERVREVFGYEPRELCGKCIDILVPRKLIDQHIDLSGSVLGNPASTVEIGSDVLNGRRKDGSQLSLEMRLNSLQYNGNLCVLVVISDVSDREFLEELKQETKERKQVEGQLKENERHLIREKEFLNALLEHINEGIVACDAQGNLSLFNRASMELHNLPQENIPPDKWAERYDLYKADGKTLMSKTDIPLFRSFNGERLDNEEMVIAPKNRPTRTVLASGTAFYDAEGEKLGAVVSLLDITKNKQAFHAMEQAEQRSRLLLESAAEGIYGIDTNGNTTFANPAAARMLGYEVSELIGQPMHQLVHHSFKDGSPNPGKSCPICNAYLDGRVYSAANEVLWNKSGECFPVEFFSTPIIQESQVLGAVVTFNNISERIAAEVAIKEERDKARNYLNAVEVILLMVDRNGYIELINRKGCELLGYTLEELLGENAISTIIPEEQQELATFQFKQSIESRNEKALHYENVIISKYGRTSQIVWRAAFLRDDDGVIQHVLSSGMDVTQTRRIENELDRQHLLFESVFQDAPDGMAIVNSKLEVIKANIGLSRISGYGIEQVLGRQTRLFYQNDEEYSRFGRLDQNEENSQSSEPYLVNYRRNNGEIFPGETVTAAIRDSQSVVQGYLIVIRDVSERVKAQKEQIEHERTLQSALDAAHAGCFSYDFKTKVLTWDERSCEIFNILPTQFGNQYSDWIDRIHPKEQVNIQNQFDKALQGGRNYELQYRVLGNADKEIHIHTMGSIIRDESGKLMSTMGLNLDVTKDYEINEERTRLQSQLQQAQKMDSIGQLTGGIAHDFNNMLGSILGFSELAQYHLSITKDTVALGHIDQVIRAGERARDLVKQLLAYSRKEQGDLSQLSAAPLLKEVLNMLRPILPSSIEVSLDIDDDLPELKADAVQMHQVLMNLCINARDAMGGQGELIIGAHQRKIKGNVVCASCHHKISGPFLEVAIKDSGEGIPPEIKNSIFEPFMTTKDVGQGTGMGLSMVHGIVHQHNGHITIESSKLDGTCFNLLLPYVKTERHSLKLEKVAKVQLARKETTQKQIMIVDDEPAMSELYGYVFQQQGYRVSVFNDSEQALQAFEKDPKQYDALLTDQTMPKITGVELAEKLLGKQPELPVIMLTGYSEQVDEKKAKTLGIKKFFNKPVNIDTLVDAMHGAMDE